MGENGGNIMDILINNYTLLMKAAEGINTCEYLLNEEKASVGLHTSSEWVTLMDAT